MKTCNTNKRQCSTCNKAFGIILFLIVIIAVLVFGFFFWARSANVDKSEYNTLYQSEVTHEVAEGDSTIVVATYNIGYLSGMTNNLPIYASPEFIANNEVRVIEALRTLDADIVGFQEIEFGSSRVYGTNQGTMICDSLYAYGAFAINWDKRYVPFPYWPPRLHFGKVISGQAVVSKFAISDYKVHMFEGVKGSSYFYREIYASRLAQVVTLDHPVKPIVVINIHAEAFEAETRVKQLDFVYELFWELDKEFPVILMGDFNSNLKDADAKIYLFLNDERLVSCAIDENDKTASPSSFPADNPDRRFDYIFFNPDHFELIDSRIATEFGDISDHFPCVAKLRIK